MSHEFVGHPLLDSTTESAIDINQILGKNKALNELNCSDNQLTNLDVSGCSALRYLYCDGNKFDCEALKAKYGL